MSNSIEIPGYRIVRKLGQGGMAVVYLAIQESFDREVALKIMSPFLNTDPSFTTRFVREARIVAQIHHSSIVPVMDVGEYQTHHYLSMEHLPGGDLKSRIAEGRHGLSLAVNACHAIASALDVAHRKGFVHRDIKPENILFREDGTPVLTDFGIARAIDAGTSLTMAGMMVGTPDYMSPEQVKGYELDGRSDLYSLGIIFYETLTGMVPFRADSTMSLALKHLSDSLPPLPQEFELYQPFIDRLTAKDRDDRFASGAEVIRALRLINEMRPRTAASIQVHAPIQVPEVEQANSLVRSSSAELAKASNDRWTSKARGWPARFRRWFIGNGSTQTQVDIPKRASQEGFNTDSNTILGSPRIPPSSGSQLNSEDRGPPVLAHDSLPVLTRLAQPAPAAPPVHDPAQGTRIAPAASVIPGFISDPFMPSRDVTVMSPIGCADTSLPVRLVVVKSPDATQIGRSVPLSSFPFLIGRASEADLSVSGDADVSRQHLSIERAADGFRIVDLAANGSFLNGHRIRGSEPLLMGDTVNLSPETALCFTADLDVQPDYSGQVLDRRYRLNRCLHSSMKASTYEASDNKVPRTVAVKILSPALLQWPHYREEFQRQAHVAAKLNHPHICTTLDSGEATLDGNGGRVSVPYICMPIMAGGDLAQRLKQEPHIELDRIVDWIRIISTALERAHQENIAHGGLKLSAIVFDQNRTPYLTDFALANHDAGKGIAKSVLGTPDFLSPEQWEGEAASAASDQYSLAVLTYLMVSGARPFEGQADPEIRKRNFSARARPVHEVAAQRGRNQVPREVSDVLARSMSIAAADRYASVGAFHAALAVAVGGTASVSAPQVFLSYQRGPNTPLALLMAKELKDKHRISTFMDIDNRDGAGRFPERLKRAIADSSVLVCLLSKNTLKSEWVREEIRLASSFGKPMVPVFDEIYRPEPSEHEAHIQELLHYQGVRLFDRQGAYIFEGISNLAQLIRDIGPVQAPGQSAQYCAD